TFPGVKAARKSLSYAMVQACGCHATGVGKDIVGRTIDTFTLADCPTPCGAPAAAPVAVAAPVPSLAIPLVSPTEPADAGAPDGGSNRRGTRRKRSSEEADGGLQDAGPRRSPRCCASPPSGAS